MHRPLIYGVFGLVSCVVGCSSVSSRLTRDLAGKGFGIVHLQNREIYVHWFGDRGWRVAAQKRPFFFLDAASSVDGRYIVGWYIQNDESSDHTPPPRCVA